MMLRAIGTRNRVPSAATADSATTASAVSVTSGITTPTVTAGTGTFTSVAATVTHERVSGANFAAVTVTITITTNNTAASFISVPMPYTAGVECVFAGRASVTAPKACVGVMLAGTSALVVTAYDNTYPGANGERITLTGLIKI